MKKHYALILAVAFVAGNLSAQTLGDYQATVLSQGPSNYFKLDGSLVSAVNTGVILEKFGSADGYATDVFLNTSNSYFFVDQTSFLRNLSDPLISGGGPTNTSSTAEGSITCLFRTLGGLNTGQRFLFSAGNTTTNGNSLGLFLENTNFANGDPNSLKLRFGDNTTTILQASNLAPNTWHYFALTYDESRVPNKAIWYVGRAGGTLTTGMTTNAPEAVAGEAVGLAIGNKLELDAGFRNPGSGRIDEFAIWARELSSTEISNQFAKLPVLGVLVTNVIVNDSFADGNRTNTGPLQADWWSSSSTNGNSLEAYTNQLGLISGTSGRGLHGTFAPQTLGIGETIRATFTFTTPATVGGGASNGAFKVAMMDFNNAGLAADLLSASTYTNVLYTNLPGYLADFDVNVVATSDITFREHLVNTGGRFLGTTAEWLSLGSSADAGYIFTPNTEYVGVFSITRMETDSVDMFSSISQGATLMDSFTASDSSGIANNYGMIGFWANSVIFGSTTTAGELVDNGITFSNIKIEVITYSTQAPTLNIATGGGNVVLSWTTTGTAGYNLESTPSLSAPVWTGVGAPIVVGSDNFVTNALTGTNRFYRLKN